MKRANEIQVYFIPISLLCRVLRYLLRQIVTWYFGLGHITKLRSM